MKEETVKRLGCGAVIIILAAFVLAIVLGICDAIGTHDDRNRRTDLTFEYAVFDGHEYVVYIDSHHFGLAHSPRCDCLHNERVGHAN